MAILSTDDFSFEFRYRDYADSWLYYEICFQLRGEPILNDSVIKRTGLYWQDRRDGTIIVKEWKQDGLIPVLKKALNGREACCWKPSELNLILGMYPDCFFPDFYNKARVTYLDPKMQAEYDAQEKEKIEKGILPDYILFMLMIDTHAFSGGETFSGQGLSLSVICHRNELEPFLKSLESEYQEFCARFNILLFGEK
jgi:hypothetical protein